MEFESVVDEETGIIKNVYRGTTYQNVKKIWKAPGADDNLVEVDPGDNATVTVDLHRDSAHVGTITFGKDRVITKEFDDELGTEVEAEVGKDHPWYLEITGLPEYSEADGARYSYVVIERPVSGWHTEREYDADNHLTTITNTLGVGGPETDIPVAKIWLDGADDVHRLPSVVGVFAKRDVTDTKSGIGIVENQFMGYVVLTADTVGMASSRCRANGTGKTISGSKSLVLLTILKDLPLFPFRKARTIMLRSKTLKQQW